MGVALTAMWDRWSAFSPGPRAGVRVFFAPGRVNLIGEHLDYNGGSVFPAALELGTWAVVRVRSDGQLRIASTAMPREVTRALTDLGYNPEDDYANYPKGVVAALQQTGLTVPGLDILFHGNLPYGAGLSSSASIELATAVAVRTVVGASLSQVELAKLGQQVENQYIGVNSGIMDQFAVAMGKANHALLLACDTLDYRLVPLAIGDYRLVMTNTNKRRGLADSKYNERRSECDAALAALRAEVAPDLVHLAHVTPTQWAAWQTVVQDSVARQRATHVVTEQHRVGLAADALVEGRLEAFGQLMRASHESLRADFDVTGVELDTLAQAAWATPGCIGSRMTGAGFGGCTVSLVHKDAIEVFQREVGAQYEAVIGHAPSFYVTGVGDGAREVTDTL